MKDQPITRIMTPDPLTVTPQMNAAEACRVLGQARCHHLPVVEAGVLVGMLGSGDFIKALVPSRGQQAPPIGRGPLETRKVEDIMSRELVTLPQQGTLLDAVRALARGDLHALPVVAPGHVLAGIVTSTDLVDALRDALVYPLAGDGDSAAAGHLHADHDGQSLRALTELYRAVGHYLHSGRGDLEHGRLLHAFGQARERMERSDAGF
jgi:CBS domain-containing protein